MNAYHRNPIPLLKNIIRSIAEIIFVKENKKFQENLGSALRDSAIEALISILEGANLEGLVKLSSSPAI